MQRMWILHNSHWEQTVYDVATLSVFTDNQMTTRIILNLRFLITFCNEVEYDSREEHDKVVVILIESSWFLQRQSNPSKTCPTFPFLKSCTFIQRTERLINYSTSESYLCQHLCLYQPRGILLQHSSSSLSLFYHQHTPWQVWFQSLLWLKKIMKSKLKFNFSLPAPLHILFPSKSQSLPPSFTTLTE